MDICGKHNCLGFFPVENTRGVDKEDLLQRPLAKQDNDQKE